MPSKTRNPKRSALRLVLPATSANLGPAFDAAALAMDFYIQINAHPADEFLITASGRDRDVCGKLEDHLILNTYREVLEASGRPVTPLSLQIANDIPIGKGCGSSAAARLLSLGRMWEHDDFSTRRAQDLRDRIDALEQATREVRRVSVIG